LNILLCCYCFVDLGINCSRPPARPAHCCRATRSPFVNPQSKRRSPSLLQLFASRNTGGCVAAAELLTVNGRFPSKGVAAAICVSKKHGKQIDHRDANEYKLTLSSELNIMLMLCGVIIVSELQLAALTPNSGWRAKLSQKLRTRQDK
jgi:hypothetical protein